MGHVQDQFDRPAMSRFIDPFCFNNFVDANILDDVADAEDAAVILIVTFIPEVALFLPRLILGIG